jgi:putative nucleotidyltransferase with HDIG domain
MALKSLLSSKKTFRWCGILVVILCYLLGFFEKPELITIDFRYQFIDSSPHPEILLVVIDQKSLKEFVRWPWPRHYYADLIQDLKSWGAKLTVLDMDFSSSSEVSEDRKLVEAASAAGNVVLSTFHEDTILHRVFKSKSANLPFPELSSAAAGIGSILFPVDVDGAMRRAYVEDEIQGKPVLGLAMEVARQYLDLPRDEVGWNGSHQFRLGKQTLPIQADGSFYINYVGGPQSFQTLSFADVFQKRIDPLVFRNKIVMIGATAMELKDIWKTPLGLTPGVEIHANALQTLLSGQTIYRIPPWGSLLLILLGGLVLEFVATRSLHQPDTKMMARFVFFSGLTLVMFLIFCLGSIYFFKHWRFLVDTVPVLTVFIVQYLLISFEFNMIAGQTTQIKTKSLSTIHTVGKLSLTEQPLQTSLNIVYSILVEVLKVRYMVVDLYHPKTHRFVRRIVLGTELSNGGDEQAPECLGWSEQVMQSKKSMAVSNLRSIFQKPLPARQQIRSSLFVPLITRDQQHGVLHIHSTKPDAFEEEEAMMLYTVANQLALNVENLELLTEAQRQLFSCIEGFSTALEFKDNETEGHSQRVAAYALEVAQVMGISPKMRETIRHGAMLHDIGKIGVPDAILKKPGKLSDEEMQTIKKHPEYGYRMLKNINFPEEVTLILLQHHERYDGAGYPGKLKGEDLFIGARIFSLVDTYDAIRSDRPYRKGASYKAALDELERCSGSQFDPQVVEAFKKISQEKLDKIHQEIDTMMKTKGLHTILSQNSDRG